MSKREKKNLLSINSFIEAFHLNEHERYSTGASVCRMHERSTYMV